MQHTVTARYVRISEKKLRMATRNLKGMTVEAAVPMLTLARNRAERTMVSVVKSAAALFPTTTEKRDLTIIGIMIDKGPRFKRWRPGGRGVAKKYERKTAHITITVSDKKNGK